jgi:GGDEF domain-containing protein
MDPFLATFCFFSINIKVSPSLAIPILILSVLGGLWLWERRKSRRVIEQFVSLASHACIPTYRSVLNELSNELARARRTQRALSIVVLTLDTNTDFSAVTSIRERNGNGSNRNGGFHVRQVPVMALVFPQIAYILRNTVRKSDIVACGPAPNEFVVALAETGKAGAAPFVDRFHELMLSSGLMPLRSAIAEFPPDGLTIEDLVSSARASSKSHPSKPEEPMTPVAIADRGLMTTREAV